MGTRNSHFSGPILHVATNPMCVLTGAPLTQTHQWDLATSVENRCKLKGLGKRHRRILLLAAPAVYEGHLVNRATFLCYKDLEAKRLVLSLQEFGFYCVQSLALS